MNDDANAPDALRRLPDESGVEASPQLMDLLHRLKNTAAKPAPEPWGELAALLAKPGRRRTVDGAAADAGQEPPATEAGPAKPRRVQRRGFLLSAALIGAMAAGTSGVAAHHLADDGRLAVEQPAGDGGEVQAGGDAAEEPPAPAPAAQSVPMPEPVEPSAGPSPQVPGSGGEQADTAAGTGAGNSAGNGSGPAPDDAAALGRQYPEAAGTTDTGSRPERPERPARPERPDRPAGDRVETGSGPYGERGRQGAGTPGRGPGHSADPGSGEAAPGRPLRPGSESEPGAPCGHGGWPQACQGAGDGDGVRSPGSGRHDHGR